jgi:predicted small lipoprotein YifL
MLIVGSRFDTQNDVPLTSRASIIDSSIILPVQRAEFVKRLTFFFSTLAFVFLFSGCGQSGALYLPGDPSTMAVPPEATEQIESEDGQDSSESSEAN